MLYPIMLIGAFVIFAFSMNALFRKSKPAPSLNDKMSVVIDAAAKLKANVDMFKSGIAPERLQRGANEADLQYYIGYVAALARCIANAHGIAPDGVILTTAQIETSRLFGKSANSDGEYAEGKALLQSILSTNGAQDGLRDGGVDGRYVVNPSNPGPYFGKLRSRFDVKLPS